MLWHVSMEMKFIHMKFLEYNMIVYYSILYACNTLYSTKEYKKCPKHVVPYKFLPRLSYIAKQVLTGVFQFSSRCSLRISIDSFWSRQALQSRRYIFSTVREQNSRYFFQLTDSSSQTNQISIDIDYEYVQVSLPNSV